MRAVAFDTETRGLDWWDDEQQAFLATWADEAGEYAVDLSDPDQVAQFRSALDSADIIGGHNLPFDVHQVESTLGFDPIQGKQTFETNLMSRVYFPEGASKGSMGGHGLKPLAKVFLRQDADEAEEAIDALAKQLGYRSGIKPPKGFKGKWMAYYDVWRAYPEALTNYAVLDARYTYDLHDKWSRITSDLSNIYDLELAIMPIVIEAERRGVRTDQEQVLKFKAKYEGERDQVQDYLSKELGDDALKGDGSQDALIEALFKIGVPLEAKTDTGKFKTDKFTLQEFEQDFPQISALFEYRKLEKFLATYIMPCLGQEILHPSFHQYEAWTGRMSCSRPNMQNWPKRAGKEVRSVLIPRDGYAFVVCDYEGIENRLLAYYLGDSGYREIAGTRDPHAWMAAQIWGGAVEDYIKGSDKAITHRQPAKNIMFAITYGAGRRRVRAMLRDAGMPSTTEDAAKIISAIKASLPGYYKLNKRIKAKVQAVGYVNTIMGRKNLIPKDKSYVGLNGLIQGSAADIFKQGTVLAYDATKHLGAYPLMFTHDELGLECPLAYADECLTLMSKAMCDAWELDPALAVEGSVVTTNYADA